MKNIRVFVSEFFHFLVVKFSVYFHRRVFVMTKNDIAVYVDEHPDQTARMRMLF